MRAPFAPPRLSEPRKVDADAQAVETSCETDSPDPGVGAVRLATGFDRLGVGVHLPWLRQARRCERRAHSPRAAEGMGSQPAGSTGESADDSRGHPEQIQQCAVWRQEGLAWRPDRLGWL